MICVILLTLTLILTLILTLLPPNTTQSDIFTPGASRRKRPHVYTRVNGYEVKTWPRTHHGDIRTVTRVSLAIQKVGKAPQRLPLAVYASTLKQYSMQHCT